METAASTGQSTTTLTTYQTKISLTTALQSSDRDYVYLAAMMHDDVGGGGDLSNSDFAEWRINGTQHTEGEKAIARGTYHTQITMGYAETVPGDRTLDGRYRAEVSTVTAETQWAHITVLRYKEPALTLEAEEQQGSIDVTVYVHHTAPDGTDPQEIVTSSPITVDGATNPLIINVGEGAEQAFKASDPRRLRVLLNVTSLTGGGSFVLAYNSSANPTNLETPTIATRLGLVNPTLTPTSGTTTTNFNFTIDYRHPDGTPADAVRVNVSDAGAGLYNNFTASRIGTPEVDYFVQENWTINGTLANFANMQSDSDAGASAILSQTVGTPDPSGFVWLSVPDEVALGGTLNAWVENQDLSDDGVDPNATGVILGWIANTGADEHSIARGSEDTNDYMNAGSIDCELEDRTWRMQIVKLGSNRFIDTWRQSTSQRLYVMAYTLGDDPKFLTVPTDIGALTADSTWNTITVSGLDADTDGILMLGQVTDPDDTSILVRATGSTDSPTGREWEEYHCGWLPVKIDNNDQFQYRLTSGDSATLWLVAETKGSIDWLDANRTTISTGSSGWVTRDLDSFESVPGDASGVILQVDEGTASGCGGSGDCRVLAREEGQTWTFPDYDVGSDKLLHIGTKINGAHEFDLYQENASVMDVYTHAITRHIVPGQPLFVRSGGTSGTSFSMDIGTAGTNRLVVVMADHESTGTSLTDVTVDSKSCNKVTEADNPDGLGNHLEMWYCDEDDLGASAGSVTIAIVGGAASWGVHAHLYTQVDQTGPTGSWIEEAAASVSTIEVELVDVPANGLVVMGAGNGESGSWTGWTSPLSERTDGPNPSSAVFGTASGVEASAQTDKTYIATASTTFNRGTGIVAVWKAIPVGISEALVQLNTTGIRSTGVDTLIVRYNLVTGDDTFGVWVWDFTASDWMQRGTLDQTAVSFLNYTLTTDEKSGGIVRIRLNDTSDSGSTDLNIDYQLVNNTLWSTGVTYYVNTTLAAGDYSHFFWANDTLGISNRTVTLAGPSVNGPPSVSNFRLENSVGVSRAGAQLDVDTEYDYLFNVTDDDGWSDIATDGNVSLHLWYDGNGTPTTDQRDPTACEAVGNNWTNCQDAFSSNDVYAYANDSAGGGGGGGGAFSYITPVEVTPGTASTWVDVDVSAYVPSGATGVILHVVNNAGGDVVYGLRKPLSTDNRLELTYPNSHLWAMIGINETQIFQANVADITGMDLWLTGYTTSGVTFFTNAVDKSLGSTGSWVDIDISGDTGADTAIGAIVEIDGAWTEDFGLRMKGSSDNRVAHGRHTWAIVGVDGGEVFQGNITATTIDFFVVGYVTSGATFFTNAVDKSLTSTGSWLEIDISGDTGSNTANGAFLEVNSGQSNDYGLRKNGSSENILNRGAFSNWGFVEVDANETLEGQIANLASDFYLVGYSLSGSGNDFKIQRGNVTIPTSQSTVTITAGTDYDAPASLSRAFIRIVGTRLSAAGDDTGQGAPAAAQIWMVSIQNPGNLLTSITFERYLADVTDNTHIFWEIIEYTGSAGGGNEFVVRDQAEIEQTTGTQMDGASATVTDDADVVVFLTGQRADGTTSSTTDRGLYTAEWIAASDIPRFTRGDGTGTASVSYAVVEFVGANWDVQRAEHTYVASGVEETEAITAVGSLARAFLHVQMRTANGNLDESGQRVYLSTTSTVSFRLRTGAGIFSQVGVAWVVENTQTDGTPMNVQRVSGTRGTGQPQPDEWTETITAVADMITTSIMGETADTGATGASTPRGSLGLKLTATDTVTLWRADTAVANDYRFEVVEWPTAPGSGGGGGGPGNNDTAWRDFGFALSGSITQVEVGVEWFRNNTAPILNVTVSWDGGSTWATNQTATNKSADDNAVEWLDFTSATAWTPAKLNDANLRVRVGTNASGARVDYVTVRATSSSGELTFSEQTTGANYRIELKYVDTADPSTASLGEWSVTEGNAIYNASASSLTPILSGPTTIGYEFKLALKLGFQVKQANDPVNNTVGFYNDLNSWNAEIEATDGTLSSTEQTASTGEHMEFGVYMYTNVTIGGDWSVTGFRGQTVNSNTITVTYRSNDDFNLTVWFTTHLVKGGDTIDISNVQILAAADANDNITSDTAFAGLGEANLVYILGTSSWFFPHAVDANENTTVVQFSVFIPLGQAFGTYTAQLVVKIQQKPAS
ncbi:MAG: hypothetical protein ACE5JE_08770 [Thermoplasmata archaeon]